MLLCNIYPVFEPEEKLACPLQGDCKRRAVPAWDPKIDFHDDETVQRRIFLTIALHVLGLHLGHLAEKHSQDKAGPDTQAVKKVSGNLKIMTTYITDYMDGKHTTPDESMENKIKKLMPRYSYESHSALAYELGKRHS